MVPASRNEVLPVLDGQASFPQDERGQLLWAIHGGAGHSAWQTSFGDGHCGICQTTQKVGPLGFPFKCHNSRSHNLVEAVHEILLFAEQRWESFVQKICLKHGWASQLGCANQPKCCSVSVIYNLKKTQPFNYIHYFDSRRMTWMEYTLLHLQKRKILVWTFFLHQLFTCCLQHPGLGSHVSSVVPRWLRVSGDSQRRSKRQHQQPRAQHRLDRPWWFSSSSVSSLALF